MFSACFGPSVVSDTDFQIHIIIHCSTDWLFQRSIVPPREKCIIEDSWVMQAKEVHMFSQNCTIISTEEIILLFIHGVLQRLCLLSLCFIASFNFRALLTKQNTKKIRKKDHRRMMRDQQARPVPIVCLWCMHAFGDWELQFVLNPGCHLSQTFSLWVVCVCIFSFFFRYFVYLTVRKLLCGIVYEATRGSTGACLMIFFFSVFFFDFVCSFYC